MEKILIMSLVICIIILMSNVKCMAAVDYSKIIEGESDWLAELQTPTGAITLSKNVSYVTINEETKSVRTIEPYFSNWAIIGLLENPSERNIDIARKWIQWYFNHMNMPDYNGLFGTVYVHYSDAENPDIDYPVEKYDSTDSYAGTFLTLLKKYCEVGGNIEIVTSNKENIELITGAMIGTQQTDGLTFAKPDYKVKYLMDAAETYDGFACAEWLESNILKDEVKALFFKDKKELIYFGIQNYLWNSSTNSYNWHLNAASEWQNFYPEGGAQTFPIQCNVISPESQRAKYLYKTMNDSFPDWQTKGFWTSQAYVASLMGDKPRVDAFIKSIEDMYINKGRIWPWRASEAGHIIKAAKVIRDKSNIALYKSVTASNNSSEAALINDGMLFTGWNGSGNHNEWIKVDLGKKSEFNRILIKWGKDYASKYQILVSDDDIAYSVFYEEFAGNGGTDDIILENITNKRYIKVLLNIRGTNNGINIKEIEVYNEHIGSDEKKQVL